MKTLYVAGNSGLVGRAVTEAARLSGKFMVVGGSRTTGVNYENDRKDGEKSALEDMCDCSPDVVVVAAGKVGGISANIAQPVDFIRRNLEIGLNCVNAAVNLGAKVIYLGSSCVYPRLNVATKLTESTLGTGRFEHTNKWYATAKFAVIQLCEAYNLQGADCVTLMPCNLYGKHDNYSEGGHMVAAMIKRYVDAAKAGDPVVTNWGSGKPRRELMHADDLASAVLLAVDCPKGIYNVGSGVDHTIESIAAEISFSVKFNGRTLWDLEKPDGVLSKLMDSSRFCNQTGFSPRFTLESGIKNAVEWYLQNK